MDLADTRFPPSVCVFNVLIALQDRTPTIESMWQRTKIIVNECLSLEGVDCVKHFRLRCGCKRRFGMPVQVVRIVAMLRKCLISSCGLTYGTSKKLSKFAGTYYWRHLCISKWVDQILQCGLA